jgi:dienelactone hydrolase
MKQELINIPVEEHLVKLEGMLSIPKDAKAIVIFAHGSGSSRLSPRNNYVARELQKRGLATLLFDLLTREEDMVYENRFDIPMLSERLESVSQWISLYTPTKSLKQGYFGASTGAAAALIASANQGESIGAVVSRGGRPDMAIDYLKHVKSPTLLIVGGLDKAVIEMNEVAYENMHNIRRMEIVPGATHLFIEKGTLEKVAHIAGNWFINYLVEE